MSAHDPFAPKTLVGPHRVYPDAPKDPGTEVPGHPDEMLKWLDEPGADLAERARRVDLAEEVEMGRAGRVRAEVLDALAWHRAVIEGDEPDDPDGPPPGWPGDGSTVTEGTGVPAEGIEITDGEEATLTQAEGEPGAVIIDETTGAPTATEYTDADVPSTAAAVIAWVRAAADEVDAGLRAVVAWRVEVAREGDVRATVKAELDKHLE